MARLDATPLLDLLAEAQERGLFYEDEAVDPGEVRRAVGDLLTRMGYGAFVRAAESGYVRAYDASDPVDEDDDESEDDEFEDEEADEWDDDEELD